MAVQNITASTTPSRIIVGDDFDPLPRAGVNVRIAETPDEIARADKLAREIERQVAREGTVAAMGDCELIAAAILDCPSNPPAQELALRFEKLRERCIDEGIDPESDD